MPQVNWKTRKSRLAQRICSWFRIHRDEDLCFGAILDKYCEKGMSRHHVCRLLTRITEKQIIIKDTPLWEAWKAEVVQGRCDFQFHSKFTGNKYHGNVGKMKKEKIIVPMNEELVNVQYGCMECGHNSDSKSKISNAPRHLISLKSYQCPKCGRFGSNAARFKLNGKTMYKAVVDGTEQFVKKNTIDLEPISKEESIHG